MLIISTFQDILVNDEDFPSSFGISIWYWITSEIKLFKLYLNLNIVFAMIRLNVFKLINLSKKWIYFNGSKTFFG